MGAKKHSLLSAGVDANILSDVVAGDGENKRFGGGAQQPGEDSEERNKGKETVSAMHINTSQKTGKNKLENLVVTLIQIVGVLLPEGFRAMGWAPLEPARANFSGILVEGTGFFGWALSYQTKELNEKKKGIHTLARESSCPAAPSNR